MPGFCFTDKWFILLYTQISLFFYVFVLQIIEIPDESEKSPLSEKKEGEAEVSAGKEEKEKEAGVDDGKENEVDSKDKEQKSSETIEKETAAEVKAEEGKADPEGYKGESNEKSSFW